ncbi:MAG: thioredoxin [Erysipelotrichaceae bacterium]|nr:thioredoxin [Erysipelotrichaceae bacterium]
MKIINEKEFQATVSSGVVLVDFFANWCGPCKMVGPILEKIDPEFPTIEFVKVDVDQSQSLAMQFQVQSIPTILIFKDGQVVERQVGFSGEPQLKKMLEKYI